MRSRKNIALLCIIIAICVLAIIFVACYQISVYQETVSTGFFSMEESSVTSSLSTQAVQNEDIVDSTDRFAANLYVPVTALVIALFGVAVTIYIFSCEGLRELEQKKKYVSEAVRSVRKSSGRFLIFLSFLSLFSVVSGVLESNRRGNPGPQDLVCGIGFTIVSFINIGILIWFNILLINYDAYIGYKGKQRLKKEEEDLLKLDPQANQGNRSDNVSAFLKVFGDIEKILVL